jgi:hypothetical protein
MTQADNRIRCVHCSGTGICKHSSERYIRKGLLDSAPDEQFMVCSMCGEGVRVDPYRSKPKPPTCRVCGGKGFHQN